MKLGRASSSLALMLLALRLSSGVVCGRSASAVEGENV